MAAPAFPLAPPLPTLPTSPDLSPCQHSLLPAPDGKDSAESRDRPEAAVTALGSGPSLFIGVPTLEKFVAHADPGRTVYAIPLVEPDRAAQRNHPHHAHGVRTETLSVSVQQITAEGHVLYCRIPAARLTTIRGEASDPDRQERETAWQSLWELVETFPGHVVRFTVVQAAIAVPQDLILLEGRFCAVTYDRTQKRYVPRGKQSADGDGNETDTEGREKAEKAEESGRHSGCSTATTTAHATSHSTLAANGVGAKAPRRKGAKRGGKHARA